MENAVNNLLSSKLQIDQLKSERNSLIQIYEAKLSEQTEQINYLQHENEKLQLKLNTTPHTNTNSSTSSICSCATEHRNWRKVYEPLLDNLVKQLMNALKLQESIRVEYFKLEKSQLRLSYSNSKITHNPTVATEATKAFPCSFAPSNSWTFNTTKAADPEDSKVKVNNFETIAKFQELLAQQQKQQLSLLNELSQISLSLKTPNTANTASEPSTISLPLILNLNQVIFCCGI